MLRTEISIPGSVDLSTHLVCSSKPSMDWACLHSDQAHSAVTSSTTESTPAVSVLEQSRGWDECLRMVIPNPHRGIAIIGIDMKRSEKPYWKVKSNVSSFLSESTEGESRAQFAWHMTSVCHFPSLKKKTLENELSLITFSRGFSPQRAQDSILPQCNSARLWSNLAITQ